MNCVHCGNDLGVDWKYGWFSAEKKVLVCPACGEAYRRNALPALFGVFSLAATNLLVAIVSHGRLQGFVLGIAVMLGVTGYLLRRKPLAPLVKPRVNKTPRWYQSPAPYLLIALFIVWYFMFLT